MWAERMTGHNLVVFVLLHGFAQTPRAWDGVREALGEHVGVATPVLTAGAPAIPGGCVLAGYSMGARVALRAALAAPERVRTLTLCVTWASSGPWGREKTRLWGIDQQHRTRDQTVDELLLLTLSERFYENPEAVAYVRGMMMANPHPQAPDAFARQAAASGNHETRDRLDSLEMPVHVIGAEHDILVPVWKSKELADLIPGARYTVIEGAPHGLQVENAEVFNAAVLDFLRSEQGAAV